MQSKLSLIFLILLLSFNGYSQDKYIFTASSLNLYPALESYTFFKDIDAEQDRAILTFLTENSGIFVIEGFPLKIESEHSNKLPSQIVNIGASFQTKKRNGLFQEIALSRLSSFKSSNIKTYIFEDTLGRKNTLAAGYNQKSFVMSLRYEYGKMFKKGRSSFQFGVSGIIEPTFYTYQREEVSAQDFSINASIFALSVAVAPTLSWKLSKKVFLDVKLIPKFLLADFGAVRIKDPSLSPEQKKGTREYNLPEIDFATTLQLRYMLKEPKRKRRRSND